MRGYLTTDWFSVLLDRISLNLYEKELEKVRKMNQNKKRQVVKNNRIIVKVNNDVIYDSKKTEDMSDELFYALLSYGLMDSIKSKDRNRNTPINYNLSSSITPIPAFPKESEWQVI